MNNKEQYSDILNQKILSFKLSKLEKDLISLKKAYPNYLDQGVVVGQHNVDKWIGALKEIYHQEHLGNNFKQAFSQVTNSWNDVEKFDFNNWIKFYQSGAHLKYKKANMSWYESPDPEYQQGYFLPIKGSANENINVNIHSDTDFAADSTETSPINSEKEKIDLAKAKSEGHRKKLISRLDSLEKLLRNYEDLPGDELSSLLSAIYDLKKRILKLKKSSSIESFCNDLIVREANILAKHGRYKAASFLYVIADANAAPPANTGGAKPAPSSESAIPTSSKEPSSSSSGPSSTSAAPPPSPTANIGSPSSAPPDLPGGSAPVPSPATSPSAASPTDPASQTSIDSLSMPNQPSGPPSGLASLEQEMRSGGLSDIHLSDDLFVDDNNSDDDLFVDDNDLKEADDLFVIDADYDTDNLKITLAQAAAEAMPPAEVAESPAPTPAPTEAPTPKESKDFDDQLEALLGQVTVEDVVLKVEEIGKIFKTREIPRQLALVDMMLDRLGLASFFPSLSEATNKALESNNYILSRVENILAQLRGALKTKDLDLVHTSRENPAAQEVRKNLEEREQAEVERKQMRKELEDQALLERKKEQEAPELEVNEEELQPAPEPAAPAAAQPAPAAPPARPAPPAA